jgi:DNA-binding MarR family transcriptional regulator
VEYDVLKLNNQLCFPLYAAAREITSKYKPFLDEIDLTYTQYITMMVLWEEKSASVGELGKRLYLDSGTLTPLLKRLEGKGYVQRKRGMTDERTVIVSVTEAGEKLKERAAHIPLKLTTCMPLSQEEAKTLYALLYKLLNSINADGQTDELPHLP